MITLAEIHRMAVRRPGKCAVCARKLRTGPGRHGIICGARTRKGCRKAYQAAYRAVHRVPRLRLIVNVLKHPKTGATRRVKLECGHIRELEAGELSAGRQRSHCQDVRCTALLGTKRAA